MPGGGSLLEASSDIERGALGLGSSGLVSGTARNGGGDRTREPGGSKDRRLQYCKSLQPGHEHYERCQTWLTSGRNNGPKGPGESKDRRLLYCKNLQPGHEHYERCQAWLTSAKAGRGRRQK